MKKKKKKMNPVTTALKILGLTFMTTPVILWMMNTPFGQQEAYVSIAFGFLCLILSDRIVRKQKRSLMIMQLLLLFLLFIAGMIIASLTVKLMIIILMLVVVQLFDRLQSKEQS